MRPFSLLPLLRVALAATVLSGAHGQALAQEVRDAGARIRFISDGDVAGAIGQAGCMSAELPRLWLGIPPPIEWAHDSAAAEAYAAGELKHGPLALVTSAMPVVTVAPNDALLEKLKSNMQEVRARGGVLYVLADGDTKIESSEGVNVIRMPEHYGVLSPILHVVPLQLLSYHTACARGTDVDKPRNLAKSVTVE